MPETYLDITVPLSPDMLVWSSHDRFSSSLMENRHAGATTRVTNLRLTTHTGTHVDSPYHFAVGDQTVDQLPLASLIGPCRVYDFQGVHAIGRAELAQAGVGDVPRVLLKTNNSRWIRTGPVPTPPAHLTADAAAYLVDKGILLVGLDGLTVDAPDGADVHLALLRAGLIIVETLDLSQVEPGDYDFICLPLRIAGGDGAPARAVLHPR